MLTMTLPPLKRPPSLLTHLTCYHANAAVTESLLLAPHSGSVGPLQEVQMDAAFSPWGFVQEQKPEHRNLTETKTLRFSGTSVRFKSGFC